jgi:Uma2 family endonuclease
VFNFQPEPDVVVAPGPAGPELYAQNFQLVAEILSPSNRRTEINMKLQRYCQAASNLYAMIVEPHEILVEIHARARNWEPIALRRRDDLIEMPEFGLRCSVDGFYRGTTLDPQTQAD